jgi:hypothetical protein
MLVPGASKIDVGGAVMSGIEHPPSVFDTQMVGTFSSTLRAPTPRLIACNA